MFLTVKKQNFKVRDLKNKYWLTLVTNHFNIPDYFNLGL